MIDHYLFINTTINIQYHQDHHHYHPFYIHHTWGSPIWSSERLNVFVKDDLGIANCFGSDNNVKVIKIILSKSRFITVPGVISNVLYENIILEAPEQWAVWIGPAQQSVSSSLCNPHPCRLIIMMVVLIMVNWSIVMMMVMLMIMAMMMSFQSLLA